jgi:hypothetical protein
MILISSLTVSAAPPPAEPSASVLVSGLEGGTTGSTVGPGGDLFVTQVTSGSILRVDPRSGDYSVFASGLPPAVIPGLGGPIDVAFMGDTAYALVTIVGDPLIGGDDIAGIYRIDSPNSYTIIADIGQYSIDNPPDTGFFLVTGVQYSFEAFRDGFLVNDGHHNRVLYVTLDGEISEMIAFENVVPTGLETHGNTIYVSQAGPVPHLAEAGRVMAFEAGSSEVTEVASGARLIVDVEAGRGQTLYALSQGIWNGEGEGSPAIENTGSLVQVDGNGGFEVIIDGLDRPTSMEFIQNSAYIMTLGGEIVKVSDVSGPPFSTP